MEFVTSLKSSFSKALDELSGSALNYGTKEDGAYMIGHPTFLNALAGFLSKQYGKEVDPKTLFSSGGGSMATDIIARTYSSVGDIAVSEAPTYYLAHQMFRERGLELKEVPIEADGMDVVALDKLCT